MKLIKSLFFVLVIPLSLISNVDSSVSSPKSQKTLGEIKNQLDISAYAKVMLKEFSPNDGLPQSSIMAITTDKLGRLWIGTQDGAAYYNGRKWTIVDLPNRNNSNYIQSMCAADDSSIWISANRGQVHRYKNGLWQSFDTSNGLASNIVNCIKQVYNKNGEVTFWFGTDKGVSKLYNGRWKTYNEKNSGVTSINIFDICNSGDGSIWFATAKGISVYSEGNFHDLVLPKELSGAGIFRVTQGKDGAMWVVRNGYVGIFKNKMWTLIPIKGLKTDARSTALFLSSSGDVWLGTENGIMLIPPVHKTFSDIDIKKFYTGTDFENKMGSVFCIHESGTGVIWFGTLLGLYRYIPGKWISLNDKTGLSETPITFIYEDPEGGFFFGTPKGLFQYSSNGWKLLNDKSGLSNNFVKSVIKSKDGALWVGTLGGGVDRFYKGRWKIFNTHNGLADNRVYSIIQSENSALWFATANGVSKYLNNQWVTYTTANGLAGNQVMSLFQSKDSSIWFGTRSGLSRLNNDHWESFFSPNTPGRNVVQCINSSSDGSLWFGTLSSGIFRFDPKTYKWKTYNDTTSPALANNVIYQEEEDRFGRFYFLTNKGVTRISSSEFNAPDKENYPEIFTMEDGLTSNEGMIRASIVDSKGRIWVGTTKGACYFDPESEIPDTLKKRLLIENVYLQNSRDKFQLSDGVKLKFNQNNLTFEYALLSFFKESNSLFQTQLEPYESNSSGWTNFHLKGYTNLPDGKYVFRVWGKDYAGNISGPIEFSFIISPPFWYEWWFIVLSSLLFIALIIITARQYTANKLKRQLEKLERQQIIERERTRISQDMHDTVGSSLTRIAILSDRLGREVKNQDMNGNKFSSVKDWSNIIGTTAREVIDTMNEIIWSLSPKHDNLESLVDYIRHFINAMLESSNIAFNLNLPESIPEITLRPDFRRNVFLIVKEAVNNVIKHSKAANVIISVSLADGKLEVQIKDDGTGIKDAVTKPVTSGGFGLRNMHQRAELIGARLEINSSEKSGTSVILCVDLKT
ncbi:MAG: two-component regulator propeller domain-containing protein [Ignavibacteriaceae bacterium]|nr:two-component regulator propeller domain-containing protein [Ignavibacteriaceae bacterium]